MLARVEGQLTNKDMSLEVTPAAKKLLAHRGFDPVLGARPLDVLTGGALGQLVLLAGTALLAAGVLWSERLTRAVVRS